MPMLTFAAPPIRAAIASLKAGLPAQIEQFNQQPENTVQLTEPVDDAYYFGGNDTISANGFPAVEVAMMDGRIRNFAVGHLDMDHDPTMNIVIWLEGATGELPAVYEQALGLTRCALEVLLTPHAFGPGVELDNDRGVFWRADILPADPTSEAREFQKWLVPMFLQIALQTVERIIG